MIFTIYDESTGLIQSRLDAPDIETLLLNVPDGFSFFTGDLEPSRWYFDSTGQALPLPPRPGPWAAWNGSEWVDPRTSADVQAALYAARAATSLDKSTLLIRMAMAGMLPPEDAEIAAGGVIPPTIQAALDALPPEVFPPEAQMIARIKWRSDNVISRANPVIVLAAAALGVTDEQMDAIFDVQVPA